ncbi:hypothetical protein VNO78_03980 [Psophocarpus tetragonolobus]|uniref:Uncharacterized protein n=1 Tax=Psophocarpus tetragonolobus TaxID=3891 RepID=A0AAN9XWE0_PSOTE
MLRNPNVPLSNQSGWGANIHFGAQLENHKRIFSRIANKLGGSEKTAKEYLSKCLYYVNIGNNDYIANYFLPQFYPTSNIYTREQYAKLLINEYFGYIKEMIDLGARKFVLVELGLIGCTPNAMSITNGSCDEEMNNAACIFSDKLKSRVKELNSNASTDSKFICTGRIDKTTFIGFNVNASCCKTLSNASCVPNQTPCQNTTKFVFWDGFHTSEAANQLIAESSYKDIKCLVNS